MKLHTFLAVIAFAKCVVGLSLNHSHSAAPRIVGGEVVEPGEAPWQVALYLQTPYQVRFCGGVLVDTTWVMTAAHCAYDASSVEIHLGSNLLEGDDPNRVSVTSQNISVHHQFSTKPLSHDLALIRLQEPVETNKYIQPIEMSQESTWSVKLVAYGWGKTSDLSPYSNELKKVQLKTADFLDCDIDSQFIDVPGVICTSGSESAWSGPCIGDSGGAVLLDGKLAGIVSMVNYLGCNVVEDTRVFSLQTSIEYFTPWITRIMQG